MSSSGFELCDFAWEAYMPQARCSCNFGTCLLAPIVRRIRKKSNMSSPGYWQLREPCKPLRLGPNESTKGVRCRNIKKPMDPIQSSSYLGVH